MGFSDLWEKLCQTINRYLSVPILSSIDKMNTDKEKPCEHVEFTRAASGVVSYGKIIGEVAQDRCFFGRSICDRHCFVNRVDLFFKIGNVWYHLVNSKVEFVIQEPHQWFPTVTSNFYIRTTVVGHQAHCLIVEIAAEEVYIISHKFNACLYIEKYCFVGIHLNRIIIFTDLLFMAFRFSDFCLWWKCDKR